MRARSSSGRGDRVEEIAGCTLAEDGDDPVTQVGQFVHDDTVSVEVTSLTVALGLDEAAVPGSRHSGPHGSPIPRSQLMEIMNE